MADTSVDYSSYVGRVSFPRSPLDLTNTAICPACLNPLTSSVCPSCRLDLNHPAAAELFQASTDVAAALNRRLALIGRIRYETAQLLMQQAASQAAAQPLSPATVPEGAVVEGSATTPAPPFSMSPTAAPPTPPHVPHRSSVQVILLIVGVSLLSIAAIFFLVFAFITYGLLVRSIIIGSFTLVALAAASLLKRRGLRATAEGIAVFAVVLVYLDAFAVRANDIAGLQEANGGTYWGIVLTGSAIAFILWHRASTLRVPSVVGFAAFVPGVGILAGGLADSLPTATQFFIAFAAAAAAGLVYLLPRSPASENRPAQAGTTERTIALSMAGLGLAGALLVAFVVEPDSIWAPVVTLVVVAILAVIHVIIIGNKTDAVPGVRTLGTIISGTGAVAVATIGAAIVTRGDTVEPALFWPAVAATTTALALEALARRRSNPTMALLRRVAAFSAAVVAALTIVIPLSTAVSTILVAAASGYANPWTHQATAAAEDHGTAPAIAVAALVVVTLLVTAFWAASGLFLKRSALLLWSAAAVVVLAVPLAGVVWITVAGWLLVAAIGTALLVIARTHTPIRSSLRLPIAAGSVTAMILGYSASWISIDSWGWASLAAIAIMLAGRSALNTADSSSAETARLGGMLRAGLLAATIVTALIGAAALARQVGGTDATEWALQIDALRFVGVLAIALLAASAIVPLGLVSMIDRRVTFWIVTPVVLVATLGSAAGIGVAGQGTLGFLLLPEFGTSLILGLALLCALLLWVVPRRNAALRPERIVASIAVAPTVYWVVDSFTRILELPDSTRVTAPIVAALLVAVGSLAIALLRPAEPRPAESRPTGLHRSGQPRWVREIGIAVVAVPAVLLAIATGEDAAWLVLIFAGVTALILAISADGLFSSSSRRKHFGWLAILLATAGLWWRLAGDRVSTLESYVLPVSAVLLLVAFMMWRAANRTATRTIGTGDDSVHAAASNAAPFVTLGGLLVSILPLAADATTSDPLRAFVIGAVSALLLLGGVFIVAGGALRPYLDAAAVTGAIGVLVTGAGRGAFLVLESGGRSDAQLDLWLGSTFIVLVLAAVGIPWVDDRSEIYRDRRRSAAQVLVVLAMTSVFVLETANFGSDELGGARAFIVTALFSLVYLAGAEWGHPPFTSRVGWIGLGFAAATAIIGIAVGALDPIEFGTVPVAAALIISGAFHLIRNPGARSWPHLGPGILILLLPSLIAATIAPTGDRPLWRLVGLGVLAVAVLVIGVVRRLQAPFVLGVIVTLVHGIATFSTEIRIVYEAIPGYYWLAAGGVLLIVLAARYEKRIKNLKDAALMVAALR